MGRKYYKRSSRSSGKSGIIGALLAAILGRRNYRSNAYPMRRQSLKTTILSAILKRIFKRF